MLNLNLQSEMRHPGLPHRTSSTRQDQANKQNSYTRTNLNPTQLYEQIDTLGFRLLTSVSLLSRFRQRRSNLRFLRHGEWREELANCLHRAGDEQGPRKGDLGAMQFGANRRLALASGGRGSAQLQRRMA